MSFHTDSIQDRPTRARQARRSPLVRLDDGSQVRLRPILPADRAALEAAFERLSPESRYRRFLSETPRLTNRQLAYLTQVDHRRHEALIAFDAVTCEAVATARYVADPSDRRIAEPAVTVVDDWQGRGLGSAIFEALTGRARAHGVREYRATVLADNAPMLKLLRTSPAVEDVTVGRADRGTVDVRAELAELPERAS